MRDFGKADEKFFMQISISLRSVISWHEFPMFWLKIGLDTEDLSCHFEMSAVCWNTNDSVVIS